MLPFIARRLALAVATVLAVVTIAFVLGRATGEPGALLLPDNATQAEVDALNAALGFDRPIIVQYLDTLDRIERPTPPFADPPRPNDAVHWVEPRVVVEVKFVEWTEDGRLRQPIYVGTRDDKDARSVTREGESVQRRAPVARKRTGAGRR